MSLVPYKWKCRSWPLTNLLSELAFTCHKVKWNVVVTIHVMHSYLQAWHTKQYILDILFSLIVGFTRSIPEYSRSRWPRGLRRWSAAARLLRLWVRIRPGAWMSVCCKCCVLSGRGLCDELITRPEESYRLWCVVVCDLENLLNEAVMAHWGLSRQKQSYLNIIPTLH